jgi:hypothetical protein
LLRALGFPLQAAQSMIESRRHVVDFADVYVQSVEGFMKTYEPAVRTEP